MSDSKLDKFTEFLHESDGDPKTLFVRLLQDNRDLRATVAALKREFEHCQRHRLTYAEALEKIGGPLDWHIENYPPEVRYCVTTARAALAPADRDKATDTGEAE